MTTDKRDLTDSPEDQQQLQQIDNVMDMPEVKDIPGQENIHPAKLKGLNDVTISSSDEEGKGVVDALNRSEEDESLIVSGNDTDISSEEVNMLERMDGFEVSEDNENLTHATLDHTDNEGDALNESDDLSGRDLDIAPAEQDDDMEDIGEEDEENNVYSPEDD